MSMSHAARLSVTIAAFFLIVAVLVVVGFFMVKTQIDVSQGKWCDTLKLLTAHPVMRPANPVQNPSRLEAWQLYQDFVSLRAKFGC